ncbi:MAG: T9SS type A sorting domain-containing protein [Dysgonamonadaceae bacterium]|nr:T9SS type A sorting domain-containing protein [Dysgonamonadaceae bacterium]
MNTGDKISIYNSVGTLVHQWYATESRHTTIDVSSLNRGLYFVKVNGKQIKLIINS